MLMRQRTRNHIRMRVAMYVQEIDRETVDCYVSRETRSNAAKSNYPYSAAISFAVYYVLNITAELNSVTIIIHRKNR